MKKILALLMTFILAMGLASCGSGGSEAGELTRRSVGNKAAGSNRLHYRHEGG